MIQSHPPKLLLLHYGENMLIAHLLRYICISNVKYGFQWPNSEPVQLCMLSKEVGST